MICFNEDFFAYVGAKEVSGYEGGLAYNAFVEGFILREGVWFGLDRAVCFGGGGVWSDVVVGERVVMV